MSYQNNDAAEPKEKDYGNGKPSASESFPLHAILTIAGHTHLDSSHDADTALKRIQTSGSISISPELFEKIYLGPQNKVAGDLRKTFGNPTPVYVPLCLRDESSY